MADSDDIPGPYGHIQKERCRYISATNRWYTIIYERPINLDMPDRSLVFPTVLREIDKKNGYILSAEYPDGTRETFTSFAEIEFRFTARCIDFISDEYNPNHGDGLN